MVFSCPVSLLTSLRHIVLAVLQSRMLSSPNPVISTVYLGVRGPEEEAEAVGSLTLRLAMLHSDETMSTS